MRVAINVAKCGDDWKSAKSPQWEIPRPSSAPQRQIRRDLPTATGLSDSAPGAEGGFLMGGRSSASPTGTEEQGNEQQRAPLLAPRPSSMGDLVTMALRETTVESKERRHEYRCDETETGSVFGDRVEMYARSLHGAGEEQIAIKFSTLVMVKTREIRKRFTEEVNRWETLLTFQA